jgi:phage FluMu protein Com
MPYQEAPNEPDDKIVVEFAEPTWIRCSCGRKLMWAEAASACVLVVQCPSCKKTTKLYIGFEIHLQIPTA